MSFLADGYRMYKNTVSMNPKPDYVFEEGALLDSMSDVNLNVFHNFVTQCGRYIVVQLKYC